MSNRALACGQNGSAGCLTSETKDLLDNEEFIRQMTACQNTVRAFIATLVPGIGPVDEILQNTHVEMWLKRGTFNNASFVAWACRIAHFKVLEYRSALARDRLVFDDDLIQTIAADSRQYHLDASERSGALDACLEGMLPSQRELLKKRYADGYSIKELSEQTNRPAGSLTVTLFRIRKALLQCIERRLSAVRG
jgi:RNA polymerase sigma-70 factor, ECF subfamily